MPPYQAKGTFADVSMLRILRWDDYLRLLDNLSGSKVITRGLIREKREESQSQRKM